MSFFVEGTFAGATVTLQHRISDFATGSYVAVGTHTTLTVSGGAIFISPFSDLQVNVASAGGSTSVKVSIKPIEL